MSVCSAFVVSIETFRSLHESAILAAGLDPYMGILHVDQHNKPVLSYDLIEPFRPWIDKLLIDLCWSYKLKARFFKEKGGGIFLEKPGKQLIIPAFNDFMEQSCLYGGNKARRKTHIYQFAGDLVNQLKNYEQ